ncbi:YdeI/OmpD-associated family protein [Chryseobacterium sp.]|uniref:YdeI/OmpD-associated family protein n=1 Tax=Chryseobacterium sp. TaxID=1871047 RepID=UPI0025C01661|nr:YdeI/OmpD-associated family protein [Chryseobacterium sp.]MBV8325016.1 YdeI/OmpD-associated family protein [Chryseobacterium sp.]
MKTIIERQRIYLNAKEEWQEWLERNHQSEQSVWLVCNTMKSGLPSVSWSELVDIALCFGWIDSTRRTVDKNSFMQLFSKRKSNSTWSRINKEKVQRLIRNGLMMPAGYNVIRIAKQNGSWTILDQVEKLIIPEDMNEEFKNHSGSRDYFLSLSVSLKKMMLQWITMAKRPETRKRRIEEIVINAGKRMKPERFV